jgi:NhaP-type Na+/H+ or K+/H+ antiporter
MRPAITPVIVGLGVGIGLGPAALDWFHPDLAQRGSTLEIVIEIITALALFATGLRLRLPLEWPLWRAPVRLGSIGIIAMAAIAAGAAHFLFDLTFVQALLLGVLLAPIDPGQSTVPQFHTQECAESLQPILLAESAVGTCAALPLILLLLGVSGWHDVGPLGLKWFTHEVLWASTVSMGVGWTLGALAAKWRKRVDFERQGRLVEILFGCSAAALTYGSAHLLGGYGFLAIFTLGVSLARSGHVRRRLGSSNPVPQLARLSHYLLQVSAGAAGLVVGALLPLVQLRPTMFAFALVVLFIARPLAVRVGLGHLHLPDRERHLLAWHGVHGTASIYFLMYALAGGGFDSSVSNEVIGITAAVLLTSILLHSLSAIQPFGVHGRHRPV